MKILSYTENNSILKRLVQQQEIFNTIKSTIQTLLPHHVENQFNVVGVSNNQLIIYTDSSLIKHYLQLKKNDIVHILNKWQILDVCIKIRIKHVVKNLQLPPSLLSSHCRNKILNIAKETSSIRLKELLLSIVNNSHQNQ